MPITPAASPYAMFHVKHPTYPEPDTDTDKDTDMYILVRRTSHGAITAQDDYGTPGTPLFASPEAAGEAAARVLCNNAMVLPRTAEEHGKHLAALPVGSIYEHDSGYTFRIMAADLTGDRKPIVPGLRVFNNDMRWGSVFRAQFLRDDPTAPGGKDFDGFYDVAVDGHGKGLFDGTRLTTNGAMFGKPDPSIGALLERARLVDERPPVPVERTPQ